MVFYYFFLYLIYNSDALRIRIKNLIDENNINANKLALSSGMNRSNINRFLRKQNKSITIESITLIAQSLNMTLQEFFNDKVFDDVEVKD